MAESQQLTSAEEPTHSQSDELMPLDRLPVGRRATIVALKDDSAYLYLLRLGLVVGAEIELLRSLSRGSIRIFRIDNGELALRSEGASGITVRMEAIGPA
jgi:Fe2+ transport system protein FeoA